MSLYYLSLCVLSSLVLAAPQGPPGRGSGQGGFGGPGSNPGFPGAGNQGSSPAYPWIFEYPLPIPPVAQASYEDVINGTTIQFFELTIESFQHQVYPNLGPATLWGYNGMSPGPTFYQTRNAESIIRLLNNGESAAALHLHGSPTHSVWDGWADDLVQPGEFKDYYYPNQGVGQPLWYHSHPNGLTAPDVYFGRAGAYIITDPLEDALGLPSGKYDVPLAITDKTYASDGSLVTPQGQTINFFGDTIQVNEQPWPYMSVEPRKYRLRIFSMSVSRPFNLYLFDDANNSTVEFQVISSDSGLFGSPVSSSDLVISMGERYELIVDFAPLKGSNITMMNAGFSAGGIQEFENTDKVMRFVVGNSVSDSSNNGPIPSALNTTIAYPPDVTEVSHVFNFVHGGDAIWTINGVDFNDVNNRILARPPQGTVERWQLNYASGPGVHPAHIHLVNFQVVSRTGGLYPALPYETAGLKDVIFLQPGESVEVLAFYGPWNGMYMIHCHNLIHEDHLMMDAMNVTVLEQLGYDSTDDFGDPTDPRWAAKPSSAGLFEPSAIASAVSSFAALNAYQPAASLASAEASYYSANGYLAGRAAPTVTAAPIR